MSVYVDNARIPYGRMLMSHLVADTPEELLAMVDTIGVFRKWRQHSGEEREHFDICQAKRRLAIGAGAVPITQRELGLRFLALKKLEQEGA